jgi:hypothetical protein
MRLLYRISARRLVKGASAAPSMSTSWLKLRSRDTRFGRRVQVARFDGCDVGVVEVRDGRRGEIFASRRVAE